MAGRPQAPRAVFAKRAGSPMPLPTTTSLGFIVSILRLLEFRMNTAMPCWHRRRTAASWGDLNDPVA
jgi:hypothetical protein